MKLNEIFLIEGFPFKFQVPVTVAQLARDIPGIDVQHFNRDLWVLYYGGHELEITVSEGGHILWGVYRVGSLPAYDAVWKDLQQKILQKYGEDAEIDVEQEGGGFPVDDDDMEEPEMHNL